MMNYSLDNWLYRLGLLNGRTRELDVKGAISNQGIKFNRAGADPDGGQLISVFSEAQYDDVDGIFDYKAGWWRYLPYSNGKEVNKQYALEIKGKRDSAGGDEIVPEQIWIGGQLVFTNTGATSDPQNQNRYQVMVNMAWDIGARINTLLRNNNEPVSKIAQIFAGDDGKGNLAQQVFGTAPIFRGLDAASGNFGDAPMHLAFANASMSQNSKVRFNQCDDEQLKTLLGFMGNYDDFKAPATDPDSGVTFNTEAKFKIDEETGNRIFTLAVAPVDVPLGHIAPDPFEVVRLEFSRLDAETAVLEKANFMQVAKSHATVFEVLRKVGYFQEANLKYLADGEYPPMQDLAIKYRVENEIEEMPTPPSLKREGGELVIIPLNGCSLVKKGGLPTDGVGGGTLIMSRGLKEDGTISEVSVLHGMPLIPAPEEEDYEAIMADITPWWKNVRYVVIDHDHFDHSTVEFYAQKGFFRTKEGEVPKEIVCTKEVKYIVEQRMNNVPETLRPRFKVVDDISNIPVNDTDGNRRIWLQFCKNGTRHSAQTAMQIFTGCYNDDKYLTSYLFCNDGFGFSDKGKKFAAHGPRGLAGEEGVTASKINKNVDVAFYEPTAITFNGKTTTKEEFKKSWNAVLGVLGKSAKASIFVPFSTNHEEYQSLIELFSAPQIKRNYTFVGRNAEIRGTALNKFGVNPWIDMDKVELPSEVEKQVLEPLHALMSKKNLRIDNTEELSKGINSRIKEIIDKGEVSSDASTEIYILKSMLKNDGKFKFDTSKCLEAYNMYQAIIVNGFEKTAVVKAGRGSQTAKDFREKPENLAIITTGPSGTDSEHFASISRYKNFWSLLDANERVANTGYYMDPKDSVICITQPAPPIKGAEEAQEQLIKDVIKNRDVTVVAAYRNGFRVYNPKDLANGFIEQFSTEGFQFKMDAVNNEITVYNQGAHIHGHGCREDVKEQVAAVPALTHEVLHIPSAANHQEFMKVVGELGKYTSIKDPDDHVVRKFELDREGNPSMPIKAYLQQSFMMLRLFYQFGKPWRPLVEMKRHVVPRADGTTRRSGLAIRKGDGEFASKNAIADFNNLIAQSNNPEDKGYRYRKNNPSKVDQKPEGQTPSGRMAFGNVGKV